MSKLGVYGVRVYGVYGVRVYALGGIGGNLLPIPAWSHAYS